MLEVVDLKAVARIGKIHQITTAVDSTFGPAPMQFPIKAGIDIVIHSLTKYLGGHSDVVGGAIISTKKYIDDMTKKAYPFFGPTMSPFTAYFVLRGITTLKVRLDAVNKSAQKIAEFLQKHPRIDKVYYPGLKSHTGHQIAKKQMNGFGGVMSFEMKGDYKAAQKFADSIKLFSLAVSLGGVESLIEHPASMTHSELTEKEMKDAGIQSALVRIAVGLEDTEDLIEALDTALSA